MMQRPFNSPDTTYPEISDKNVSAKSTDRYAIYSMNDHVLFANNKSEISTEGKAGLRKIGASIYQRFKDADVRIYSQPDSLSQANLQLANQRAEAVKNFLLTNSKLNENHLSIFPNRDSTSNASVSENQRNNGIAIVAKR